MLPVAAFSCLFLLGCLARQPEARAGQLDFSKRDFQQAGPARLDGEWEFFWHRLAGPEEFRDSAPQPDGYFPVPGVWNGQVLNDGRRIADGDGFATLRLLVRLPSSIRRAALKIPILSTAYRLYVNGELLSENGVVSQTAEAGRPENRPVVVAFKPAPGLGAWREAEIIVQVSNYHIQKGGLRVSFLIGPEEEIRTLDRRLLGLDLLLFGSLLVMGLYHLGLFVLRREDRSLLYFAIFCLLIALRTVVTGERFLATAAPGLLGWQAETRLDFLTVCLAPIFFLMFIRALFPLDVEKLFVRVVQGVGIAAAVFVLVFPARIYSGPVVWLLYFFLGSALYGTVKLVLAAFRGRDGAALFLSGFVLIILTFVNDVLYASGVINTARLVPLGLFGFTLAQSMLLSIKFSNAFRRIERMSLSMSRFVPQDFLKLLGRERIEDVGLGDQVEREMTVLFSDIRDFTAISEGMTPGENFAFLNAMLRRLGPLIRDHGGFIDKYIGDAIMALFPNSPEDAVRAAIRMNEELEAYNERRAANGYAPIIMGVGIHSGRLMLGTIGEEQRVEGTVISDSVNLASRLEGQTKTYGARILISEAVLFGLADPDRYSLRMLGRATLKGKREPVSVFEVFDADPPEARARKLGSRRQFEKAIQAFFNDDIETARRLFSAIQDENPADGAAAYYLARIQELPEHPTTTAPETKP